MVVHLISTKDDRAATLVVLRSVMSRVFGVPEESITESTRHTEIDRWDSLNMVIVAIGLERRLDRPIEAASLMEARSVAALLDRLCTTGVSEA